MRDDSRGPIIVTRKGKTFLSFSCDYGLVLFYILFVKACLKKTFMGSELDYFPNKMFITKNVLLL